MSGGWDAGYAPIWQDRQLRFDCPIASLKPRKGEFEIDSINSVEDSKGNNGDRGFLVVTNLRFIWASHNSPRTNLSIGLNAIIKLSIKAAKSRLRGSIQALFVLAKWQKQKYEFIFTSLVRKSPRLFTTAQAVFRSYETTKLYRDLKLRGALLQNKQLNLLPLEQVYHKVTGVWNLSSDQGNLGTFFITNVRLVWHANLAENFNVSIPYAQMAVLRIRPSKFGPALVCHVHKSAGGYVLGFRLDPADKLKEVFEEIKALRKVFAAKPIFGIEYTVEEVQKSLDDVKISRKEDDLVIAEDDGHAGGISHGARRYIKNVEMGDTDGENGPPAIGFSADLGLAIEELPDALKPQDLWNLYV
eukprot:g718.t1